MAMRTRAPKRARRRISSAKPSRSCAISKRSSTAPAASMTHTACVCTAQSRPTKKSYSWTDSWKLRYDCPCRKARREAHQSALLLGRRGATSWGPSWPSGTLQAAGLMRAFERPARRAVTARARKSVDTFDLPTSRRQARHAHTAHALNTGCPPRRSVGSSQAPTDRRRGQPCAVPVRRPSTAGRLPDERGDRPLQAVAAGAAGHCRRRAAVGRDCAVRPAPPGHATVPVVHPAARDLPRHRRRRACSPRWRRGATCAWR